MKRWWGGEIWTEELGCFRGHSRGKKENKGGREREIGEEDEVGEGTERVANNLNCLQ